MDTVALGNTGERVSQLALGAMLMGTRTGEADSFEILDRYLAAGGSFVDTADCYAWWPAPGDRGGESESLLGRWFAKRGRRDDVFLATKGSAWIADPEAVRAGRRSASDAYEGAGGDTLRRAVDGSLRRLGTDHIDLYYVHVDDRSTPIEETLQALDEVVRAGKVRHIGWSNVRTWRLERVRQIADRNGWPAPVALQQQHSYLRRRAGLTHSSIVDDEQLDYLRANPEVTLVAYSPILKGIYDDPEKRRGHDMMAAYEGPDADARLAVLTELAGELGVTPNQLVVAWLLHQTDPALVTLLGPRTVDQFAAALPALDVKLDESHLSRLDAASA
ncbi:aldo/keto reductase [Phytohabitans sp. ZYX-F-186]|uniref:Aldo/keto reductase n=1 Tax=Phytohabitans maris TaxID=3071409 RepID=A0ABU0ZW42_9ACTN|nr:aldo/keto reductase [Phytohabitans sp. ZYX-F-186]MDQ7911031.1 aldo/keto reductase [Phytohabitans sp. ZYX-F-186]